MTAQEVEQVVFAALSRHGLSRSLCTEAARAVRTELDAEGMETEDTRTLRHLHAIQRDARTYREACALAKSGEPSVTHAQLAAVCNTVHEWADSDAWRGWTRGTIADEVYRRATGGQVPETLDKAAKWDAACARAKDSKALVRLWFTHKAIHGAMDAVPLVVADVLGLTLPTAPGGNPSTESNGSPDSTPPGEGETDVDERPAHKDTGRLLGSHRIRPRIAPTPTPEHVAPAARCGAMTDTPSGEPVSPCDLPAGHNDCEDWLGGKAVLHRGWCLGSRAVWSADESAPDAGLPQPSTVQGAHKLGTNSAPVVVWKGDGVRVESDGFWMQDGRHVDAMEVSKVIARALAEAKRFEREWAEKDGNSPGYNREKARNYGDRANEFRLRAEKAEAALAKAKRESADTDQWKAGVIRAADMRVRKAAEAMRERAALAAFDGTCDTCHRAIRWDEHGGEAGTGAWSHVEPANGCMVSPNGSPLAAARIRALPLEAK